MIKIGHCHNEVCAAELLLALAPWVSGLAMTNSIATTVVDPQGKLLFDGQQRGICGSGIRQASIGQAGVAAN